MFLSMYVNYAKKPYGEFLIFRNLFYFLKKMLTDSFIYISDSQLFFCCGTYLTISKFGGTQREINYYNTLHK